MNDYKYIVGGRSTGKTRKLLELAKEKNALVICKNPAAMGRKAEAYGIYGLKFAGYGDSLTCLLEDTIGNPLCCEKFVVDETKEFLDYIFAANCVGYSQTEDD